jgi:LPXTG-site transpeptidase (sortase) family protein
MLPSEVRDCLRIVGVKPIRQVLTAVLFLSLFMLPYSALPGSALPFSAHPVQAGSGGRCYVWASAGGSSTGSSWTDAYPSLQSALDNAACTEIWVAAGVYKPTYRTKSSDSRSATFQLKSGVAIYGGFSGVETAREQRSPLAHLTVLSGDIDNNDSQTPVVTDPITVTGTANNSYNVVYANGPIPGAVLDGFTITAGYAASGGGMYIDYSNPTLTNLTFSGNWAWKGGGLYLESTNETTPTLTNLTFQKNRADSGGGIYLLSGNLILTNSTFSGNQAASMGGGIFLNGSSATLTNLTFSGNQAASGGGIATTYYELVFFLKNVILWGDSASQGGNEIFSSSPNTFSFHNSIIRQGGCGGAIVCYDSPTSPNLGPLQDNGGSTPTMALGTGSSAIDAGSDCSATDQRGVSRPQGSACDIGAYEAGAEVLKVSATSPSASAVLTGLSTLTVTFSEDALHDASAQAANTLSNYLLVEQGANASFDTTTCATGRAGDDVQHAFSSVTYANHQATLTLSSPLTLGSYRLFVCGTTSIWSTAGLKLNNGASDTTLAFSISASPKAASSSASDPAGLPATGFAPGVISRLVEPSVEYAEQDTRLEIPVLGVDQPVVGVPQDSGWDVSWLGSRIGYLEGTAFPSLPGNSVLAAHVYAADGLPGTFARLRELQYGDTLRLHAFGQTYVYAVRDVQDWVPATDTRLLTQHEERSWLTLVTCRGYNPQTDRYDWRTIVRAVLMTVEP